jgi:hypothetical protein
MVHRSLAVWTAAAALLLILASALSPAVSQASPPALPPRPEEAKPGGGGSKGGRSGEPAGARIELHAPQALAGGWTVVQWQDRAGNWHDVEGWRGRLDGGVVSWWVHPKDFGSGPFRWTVSEQEGGKLLGASRPFSLPGEANQVLQVTVMQ